MTVAGLYLVGVALLCGVSFFADAMGFNPALLVLTFVCGWAGIYLLLHRWSCR